MIKSEFKNRLQRDGVDAAFEWVRNVDPLLADRVRRLRLLSQDFDYRLDQVGSAMPGYMVDAIGGTSGARTLFRGCDVAHAIRPGDWVSLDESYARLHGAKVASLEFVDVCDIYWAGTDEKEFIYLPSAWCFRAKTDAQCMQRIASDDHLFDSLLKGETHSLSSYDREIAAIERRLGLVRIDSDIHGREHARKVGIFAQAAARSLGIDPLVPYLFSVIHDAFRETDGHDPGHGERAAQWVRGEGASLLWFLKEGELDQLARACQEHSSGDVSDQPIVAACWDGDRLDLGRIGVILNPRYLSTQWARQPGIMDAAALFSDLTSMDSPQERSSVMRWG